MGVPTALTPLELASGVPTGRDADAPPLPPPTASARSALEAAVTRALLRQPCIVSFSGGRDSSAILALAAAVARREGLPLPVPVTARFPDAPAADEDEWQVAVIDHLGLRRHWVRLELGEELDLIGEVAAPIVRAHGVLWPPNTHFHVPLLRDAGGGSLLTGIDGDGLLAGWRWRRAAAVAGGRAANRSWRSLAGVAVAYAPAPVRRLADRGGAASPIHWLRPDAAARLARVWRRERASEPARWPARVAWYARGRGLRLTMRSLDRVAQPFDVETVHPLADPHFLAAMAWEGGRTGPGTRTDAMRSLFGDVLPPAVLERSSKALMDEAFWTGPARRFAASWDGTGVDHDLVDPGALREEWLRPTPDARSSLLLQAAYLATAP